MNRYSEKKTILNKEEMGRTVKRLAHEIVERNFGTRGLVIIGIQTRGIYVARRLADEIVAAGLADGDARPPLGTLDITLYRDDVGTMAAPPLVKETDIPVDLTDRKVILVDDVIFTGRTIRAALDEIMDYSRPKNIQLAVLVDRGHRELPIEPNFVGKRFPTAREERIDVELEEVDGRDRVVLKELAGHTR